MSNEAENKPLQQPPVMPRFDFTTKIDITNIVEANFLFNKIDIEFLKNYKGEEIYVIDKFYTILFPIKNLPLFPKDKNWIKLTLKECPKNGA